MENIVIVGLTDEILEPFRLKGFKIFKGNVQDIITREWMGRGTGLESPLYFVSPANSLGFMDGGIDKAYMGMFKDIQKKVQTSIRDNSPYTSFVGNKYLPIGSAITVEADNHYLISAPTMLMPQPVTNTRNPYYAMKAIMKVWPRNGTLIVPPLACGYGMIRPEIACEQILEAINENTDVSESGNYIDLSEYIMNEQPKYYENTAFFNIDPSEVINKPRGT